MGRKITEFLIELLVTLISRELVLNKQAMKYVPKFSFYPNAQVSELHKRIRTSLSTFKEESDGGTSRIISLQNNHISPSIVS